MATDPTTPPPTALPASGFFPAKITWKSLLGLLGVIAGTLSATNVAKLGLPPDTARWIIAVGGALIAVDRVAEAVDNAVKTWWRSLPLPTQTELGGIVNTLDRTALAHEVAQHITVDYDKIRSDINAELARVLGTGRSGVQSGPVGAQPAVAPTVHVANPPPPEPGPGLVVR